MLLLITLLWNLIIVKFLDSQIGDNILHITLFYN